jgi:hypothetical protein
MLLQLIDLRAAETKCIHDWHLHALVWWKIDLRCTGFKFIGESVINFKRKIKKIHLNLQKKFCTILEKNQRLNGTIKFTLASHMCPCPSHKREEQYHVILPELVELIDILDFASLFAIRDYWVPREINKKTLQWSWK